MWITSLCYSVRLSYFWRRIRTHGPHPSSDTIKWFRPRFWPALMIRYSTWFQQDLENVKHSHSCYLNVARFSNILEHQQNPLPLHSHVPFILWWTQPSNKHGEENVTCMDYSPEGGHLQRVHRHEGEREQGQLVTQYRGGDISFTCMISDIFIFSNIKTVCLVRFPNKQW